MIPACCSLKANTLWRKQNRILNTSVLVAAKSKITVPVSCVEQGRWRYVSRQFHSGVAHSSPRLRHALKLTVTVSLRTRREHRSDQGKVWAEVARQQRALGVCSGTTAMSDTLASHVDQIDEFQQKLRYVEEASGLAVAVGGKSSHLTYLTSRRLAARFGRDW